MVRIKNNRTFAPEKRQHINNTTIMATASIQQTTPFTINIPKVDLKRFKGLAKAMGWPFEENIVVDETEYIMTNTKIMESIREGERAIAEGKVKVTKLEDLWK